jgi:hypothetical protein
MKEKFAKLLSVKSIVTIVLTGVFSALALTHYITPDQTLTIYTTIIAFYFGTQHEKSEAA